jgi:hypothetical protein
MSHSKKSSHFDRNPGAVSILEEYRKAKKKTSQTDVSLSQKIMEITTAGSTNNAVYDWCILCDAPKDVCDPCDASDWVCQPEDGICISRDNCDGSDVIQSA